MALYTPFMAQAGRDLGGALARRGQSKLFSSAYMGEPGAMEELAAVNPAMAMKLQKSKQEEEQLKVQQASKKEANTRKLFTENKEIVDQVIQDVAAFDDFSEAQDYFERKKEENRPIFGDALDNVQLTEQMYNEARTIYGDKPEEAGGAPGFGNVSPKDFTVESMSKYSESGELGDLVRYTPKVKDIAGVPHQYNQESLKWEPLVDMRSADITDQTQALANIEADKQSKLDFTKAQSKFKNSESKLISKIDSSKSKHKILTDTSKEIKKLISGWSAEWGASLRNLPDTEARQLEGLINTIRANSAFGTLKDLKESGGTLGAISAPELVLLEAALGNIDQYGDIPEQLRVLDQIIGSNQSSIDRISNAYKMDKKKFGTSFEKATKEAPRDNGVTVDELVKKYAD